MIEAWHEEAVSKKHDRSGFDCGDQHLNLFLTKYARQSHAKGAAKTYCAIPDGNEHRVLGFYSLNPASISFDLALKSIASGMARHEVPVFRLCRLAVDKEFQGQGLGGQLLIAAGRRSLFVAQQVGGIALLIDAKNQSVANWYRSYGATQLLNLPKTLLLPLKTIEASLKKTGKL